MRKLFSSRMAVILTVVATIAWAASIEVAYGTIIRSPVDPPACEPCQAPDDMKSMTRKELTKALGDSLGGVSFTPASGQPRWAEPIPPNCVKGMSSCGTRLGCYKVFGGGSQYAYGNGILACRNQSKDCYDVYCRVKMYSNPNCSGDPDDETYVERRGCKEQKAIGIAPGEGIAK